MAAEDIVPHMVMKRELDQKDESAGKQRGLQEDANLPDFVQTGYIDHVLRLYPASGCNHCARAAHNADIWHVWPQQLKKELQRLGQVYGLHYCLQGVLFRPALSSIVKPIECVMYDYMHILLASGGLAQYQLNSFVKRLKDEGITLEMMDAFAQSMFFSERLG